MSAVSEAVLIVVALRRHEILRKRRKKRCWIKKWIARREVLGASNNLCVELQIQNEDDFKDMFRVNRTQFYYLLDIVDSSIQRQNTTMRNTIPARTKLETTLKYLATGDSLITLSQLFRVPKCTISTFLVEVLEAIYSALEDFIKVPTSEDDWNKIRRGFLMRWNFPNCFGAIDGKHIDIKCPPPSLSPASPSAMSKKTMKKAQVAQESALNKLNNIEKRARLVTNDDDLVNFGKHVAFSLRILNNENSIHAQDEIQAILSKYKLHDLKEKERQKSTPMPESPYSK